MNHFQEKIESLREECAELHRRESTHAEQCQRDAELRVQQAMAAYLHLPDEIESLKAVLDMKNQEVRELRMQHMEHTKQVRTQYIEERGQILYIENMMLCDWYCVENIIK